MGTLFSNILNHIEHFFTIIKNVRPFEIYGEFRCSLENLYFIHIQSETKCTKGKYIMKKNFREERDMTTKGLQFTGMQ